MSLLRRFLRRLAAPFRSGSAEADLAREIRAHLQLLEDRFRAEGMSPVEARYAAQRAFGGIEQAKEHQRDARSFRWMDNSRSDFKLGARMLAKSPGLSIIGGIGLAVAIAMGTSAFGFLYPHLYAPLPIDEGARIVALENWDVAINNEARRAVHDYVEWRDELRMVPELGAFRTAGRNMVVPGGALELARVGEMTASAFQLARVAPILGRPLLDDDERPGAPPVLVIGFDVWQSRFAGDANVVGRTVRLADVPHTVIGVMPEGFRFPVNHSYWTPLAADTLASAFPRGEGPAIFIFGRLADGATPQQAQAELSAIGARNAARFPDTHKQWQPRIYPYAHPILDIQGSTAFDFAVMQGTISLLLIVVALNVAILVYARTARRQGEIAVRTALGATRRRIVGQLFIEALVLSAGSAGFGLVLARFGLAQGHALVASEGAMVPYWIEYGMSGAAYLYVAALTLVSAIIAGVLPALHATGRSVQVTLRDLGGGSGLRLGRTWTLLIVAQVALAVGGLPIAIAGGWTSIRSAMTGPSFDAEPLLAAEVAADPDAPPGADPARSREERVAHFGKLRTDLVARLEAEPAIAGVAVAMWIPGEESSAKVEFDNLAPPAASNAPSVQFNSVAPGYFDLFNTPLLTGRHLEPGDRAGRGVLVNRAFVDRLLAGRDPMGIRLRYIDTDNVVRGDVDLAEWHEIVGVVADFHTNPFDPALVDPAVFHALDDDNLTAVSLVMRVRSGTAAEFAPLLRTTLASLDPTARLFAIPVTVYFLQQKLTVQLIGAVMAGIIISVLLLSAAGIYALMSFTVSQRKKEIGIRTAMGADPSHLLRSIFTRAAGQLAAGVATGTIVVALLDTMSGGELLGNMGRWLLPAMSVTMIVVGLVAAIGPARRGLRIQPTEALRDQ